MTDQDRPPLRQLARKPKPPSVKGLVDPPTPEPEPEPEAPAQKPKRKGKPKASAGKSTSDRKKARHAAATQVVHYPQPAIVRTATRLPSALAKRVRSAAQAQGVARARLLLIAFLAHEADLPELLHRGPVTDRDHEYASVGLDPDPADAEPTEMVTWNLPERGMARLDETRQEHGVTRTAVIRAVLEAEYPEPETGG